jgi:dihydroorotase
MDLLLKNITIIDSEYTGDKEGQDILIQNGRIVQIAPDVDAAEMPVKYLNGACVSIGWMDVGVQTGDPGYEHREDLQSIAKAAAAGGYTAIACQPNNAPVTDNKGAVLYIVRNTSDDLVDFFPIGALTQGCKGETITEMIDMYHAGAVAFSDGRKPIQHAGVMLRALQYVRSFDGVVVNQPLDETLAHHGQMHEGITSTSLGMRGIPDLAESLMVQRDIYLTEYCSSKLHIAGVSSAQSVAMIRAAKAKGLAVSAAVPAINLAFIDEEVIGFDTNLKVLPPLRGEADRQALRNGVQDGTIALVSSNHDPLETEAKKLEFPYADFGVIGLQTTFSVANTYLEMPIEKLVDTLARAPRQLMGVSIPQIAVGEIANLTIFDPTKDWTFTRETNHSKSANSPFFDKKLKGQVLGVVNNRKSFFLE